METTFTYAVASSNRSSQPALSPIEGFNRFASFKTFQADAGSKRSNRSSCSNDPDLAR